MIIGAGGDPHLMYEASSDQDPRDTISRTSHPSPMKVLRIIARLNVGGPARHVVWLTEGLNEHGYRSTLVAGTVPDGEEDMSYLAADHGLEPIYIKEMSRELSLLDVVSLWKIYRLVQNLNPDIVHTHTAKAGTIGRLAAFAYRWLTPGTLIGRPRRLVIVHTFHGHVFHSYYGRLKTNFFLTVERILARTATDKIVVITEQQFEEISSKFRVGDPNQFRVIRLGIDLSPFKAIRERNDTIRSSIGASENDLVVAFVGRLTEIKDLSLLLKAVAGYRKANDKALPNIRLIVCGDGHLRRSLETEALQLGIADGVSFVGNRRDTASIYGASDIVALSSLNEGTPLSLIEAMAAGRPVISTSVGGVVDLLGTKNESLESFDVCERGIGVAAGAVDGFINGLIYLAKDERLRKSLGEAGRSFVVQNYSKERLISDVDRLYRELTAEASEL